MTSRAEELVQAARDARAAWTAAQVALRVAKDQLGEAEVREARAKTRMSETETAVLHMIRTPDRKDA